MVLLGIIYDCFIIGIFVKKMWNRYDMSFRKMFKWDVGGGGMFYWK